MPLRLRLRVRIAAAADYFFTRRWLATLVALFLNAFPFERKQPACLASLAYTEHLLQQGQSLLIFPEGTRTRDGQMQHFKHGVGRIVRNSGVSVVPTWIDGTFTALPKGAHWLHQQNITVKFGTPLHFSQDDDPTAISTAIEREVRALALSNASTQAICRSSEGGQPSDYYPAAPRGRVFIESVSEQ